MNKAEPTLALKPRGDITRNPKQGYQWPQKGHVSTKHSLKNKTKQKTNCCSVRTVKPETVKAVVLLSSTDKTAAMSKLLHCQNCHTVESKTVTLLHCCTQRLTVFLTMPAVDFQLPIQLPITTI